MKLREIEIDSASVISGSLQHGAPCVTRTRPEVVLAVHAALLHTEGHACVDTCAQVIRLTSQSMLLLVLVSRLPSTVCPFITNELASTGSRLRLNLLLVLLEAWRGVALKDEAESRDL